MGRKGVSRSLWTELSCGPRSVPLIRTTELFFHTFPAQKLSFEMLKLIKQPYLGERCSSAQSESSFLLKTKSTLLSAFSFYWARFKPLIYQASLSALPSPLLDPLLTLAELQRTGQFNSPPFPELTDCSGFIRRKSGRIHFKPFY